MSAQIKRRCLHRRRLLDSRLDRFDRVGGHHWNRDVLSGGRFNVDVKRLVLQIYHISVFQKVQTHRLIARSDLLSFEEEGADMIFGHALVLLDSRYEVFQATVRIGLEADGPSCVLHSDDQFHLEG